MASIAALLVCLFQANLVAGAGSGYGYNWTYEKNTATGPSLWGAVYPHCASQKQSPINIMSGDAEVHKELGVLVLSSYDQNASFVMKNRDTDIEFRASGEPKAIEQTVTWNGTVYRLFQLHFHWGMETHQGSEHQIDSQQYAAEMHIIHYNDKYDNVSQALDKEDGLLVWGHFLQVTSNTHIVNPYFSSLVSDFERVKYSGNTTNVELNLKKLLPAVHDKYYHYTGSLTTPPCHESVKWIVSTQPIRVSEHLMQHEFRSLIDQPMSNVKGRVVNMGNNYRPIQNLNNRTVFSNFDPTEIKPCLTTSDAAGALKPLFGVIGSLCIAIFFVMS